MTWLYTALLAYSLFGLVTVTDKYLLKARIPNPKVYAFYVGLLSIVYLIFIPFGFTQPSPALVGLNLLTGACAILALFSLYLALEKGEASRVGPIVGGLVPIFTFIFLWLFSPEKISLLPQELIAFLLLILGTVLICWGKPFSQKYSLGLLVISALASFFFALFFTLAKFVYLTQPFISGLIWIKIGSFLTGFVFLFFKDVRHLAFKQFKGLTSYSQKTALIFIGKNLTGGLGYICQNLAVSLARVGQVAFISALQGVQYIFVLILAIILAKKLPHILKEEISREVLWQKIIAILLISFGLAVLAFR